MNVWLAFLGSLVRWALAAVLGGLVVRGIISEEMLSKVTGEGATQITAGLFGLLIPLLWSFYEKIKAKIRVLVALNTPVTATTDTVEKDTDAVPLQKKVSVALSGDGKDSL